MSLQLQVAGQQVDQGTDSFVTKPALDVPPASLDFEKSCSPKLFHVMGHGSASYSPIFPYITDAFSYLLIKSAGCSRWTVRDQAQKYCQAMWTGQGLEYLGKSFQFFQLICGHI